MTLLAAAFVPGMPHLLAASPAPSWRRLAEATREVGVRLRRLEPDAVLLMCTQWFTVLGHQLQLDPNPRGRRTDENWYAYDYGHIAYDLRMDADLAACWADEIDAEQMQARRTRYDGFPIDTGTVTASALLDPDRRLRYAQVSCNLYADAAAMGRVGAAGRKAASRSGKRVAVVAVSGLSGLIQRWIRPEEDAIATSAYEEWDRRILDLLARGRVDEALAIRTEYGEQALADSQLRALPFLHGADALTGPADVLEYGPVWGTGNAVVYWQPEAAPSRQSPQH
jgi:2-aminophenol/2-amino-5-chlorophenol 1,6-dioxygenase alpha subunit